MRKDKARDIARGVLPSTARKGARDNKRAFHAKRRHNQRLTNHALVRHLTAEEDGRLYSDVDLYDDFEDPVIHDGYHAATKGTATSYDDDMPYIVSRRRDADNLGPLFSWARATDRNKMAGWTTDDKRAYFKAILPDTLQGRHALGHIEQILDLYPNPFEYGFFRYREPTKPVTKDDFRAALSRCLNGTKARSSLREYIHEVVPVAAHSAASNLKRTVSEQARDENGQPVTIYSEVREYDHVAKRFFTVRKAFPKMVDVPVPVEVSTACDDCSFLRNDPLATTEAINRFVDIIWNSRQRFGRYRRPITEYTDHTFFREVYNYIMGQAK